MEENNINLENKDVNEETEKPSKLTAIDLKKAPLASVEKHITEFLEFNLKMETLFNNERNSSSAELKILFDILGTRDYKNFIELQAKTLALRQIIQEKISFYMQKLVKANANFDRADGDRVDYYAFTHPVKITDATRAKLIKRDLSERGRNCKLIETHIEFLRECRTSCDQINYAVKNMVGLITYISILEN